MCNALIGGNVGVNSPFYRELSNDFSGIAGLTSTVGSRLREERRKTGLSQEEFARLSGVGKNSQFEYETDKTAPNTNYLARIADHGADPIYVVSGVRIPDSNDARSTELVQILAAITDDDRQLLLSIARRLAGAPGAQPTIHDKRSNYTAGPQN